MPVKILITGGTGFVGGHLAAGFARRGDFVTVLSRYGPPEKKREAPGVEWKRADIGTRESLEAVGGGFELIVHAAAARDSCGRRECFRTNVLGTRNLLDFAVRRCKGLFKFIYVSSLGAAGFGRGATPKRESDLPEPVSYYGRTKLEAEKEVLAMKNVFPVVVLRPPKIYGPGDRKILLHFKLVRYGMVPDLELERRFMSLCYAGDFARAVIAAADSPERGAVYFVSDGKVYSWMDFYRAIAFSLDRTLKFCPVPGSLLGRVIPHLHRISRLPGFPVKIEPTTVRELRSRSWTCDSALFAREFGFRPETGIEEGMRRTAEWFQVRSLL